jgi:hypothetical protein
VECYFDSYTDRYENYWDWGDLNCVLQDVKVSEAPFPLESLDEETEPWLVKLVEYVKKSRDYQLQLHVSKQMKRSMVELFGEMAQQTPQKLVKKAKAASPCKKVVLEEFQECTMQHDKYDVGNYTKVECPYYFEMGRKWFAARCRKCKNCLPKPSSSTPVWACAEMERGKSDCLQFCCNSCMVQELTGSSGRVSRRG